MPTISEAYQIALKLHREGRTDLAEEIYRNILAVEPGHAQSWHLLGVAAIQRHEFDRAVEWIERAISLDASRSAFFGNLGVAYRDTGQAADAERVLRRALELSPDFENALCNLGLALCDQDRCDEAIDYLRRALMLKPDDTVAAVGLAYALGEVGFTDEALEALQYAGSLSSSPRLRLPEAVVLPLVYRSIDDLRAWRVRLEQKINRLIEDGTQYDLAEEAATPVFGLAYHAMNDREIQRKIASLYRAPVEGPLEPGRKRGDGRINVGFISRHFDRHTIGKLQRGMIAELSRDEFFVTVLSIGHGADDVADFIRSHADRYIELPRGLPQARQVIREAGLDILYYCDIGMDAMSYSLASSRLAPVQCVTWGHPVTTGIATLDYFISSRLMEPPEAEEHYTEKLVPLDSLTVFYYRPPTPEQAPREAFGLNPDAHLYICPQSIYKFHPEFDGILGEILRRDPQGRVVLLRWAYAHGDELLRERFADAMPDVADRIDFIPRLQQAEFVGLLGAADVILDPIHFGGGHTSLDALALGTPVVTLPGRFLRGRITLGLYRKMGLGDCVAEDPEQYVKIAVRLGSDPDYRRQVQARIRDANAALFEDRDSVRQLEAFFRQCVSGEEE